MSSLSLSVLLSLSLLFALSITLSLRHGVDIQIGVEDALKLYYDRGEGESGERHGQREQGRMLHYLKCRLAAIPEDVRVRKDKTSCGGQ